MLAVGAAPRDVAEVARRQEGAPKLTSSSGGPADAAVLAVLGPAAVGLPRPRRLLAAE